MLTTLDGLSYFMQAWIDDGLLIQILIRFKIIIDPLRIVVRCKLTIHEQVAGLQEVSG
jgi:hypothetical protein